MENAIDITGVDLVKFAQKVYELSVPQGMGFLHFTPKPLPEEIARQIVEETSRGKIALDMDYVSGRACKMTVFKEEEKLFIRRTWYDHTDKHLIELLKAFNIKKNCLEKHSLGCNCKDCQCERNSR